MVIERALAQALTTIFRDGGETYTREEVRIAFENEGVDVSDFDSVIDKCIEDGWLIDCGQNNYTR